GLYPTGSSNLPLSAISISTRAFRLTLDLGGHERKFDDVCCAQFGLGRGARCFRTGTWSIPRQWGCDRRATKPRAKFGATLRAAVLFGPGFVARSLQIHGRDMRVARSLPGPKTPRRKRHRIYAHDHLRFEN